LLNPEDENILVVSDLRIQIFKGVDKLPVLDEINLELTAEQIFGWLKF
jgi:hypothetical protein